MVLSRLRSPLAESRIRIRQNFETSSRKSLTSDSRYLVDGIEKGWALSWRANGWRKKDKSPALNADLWEPLLSLCETHEVTFRWVKGHAGHPENERCDKLAVGYYTSHFLG